MDRQDLCLFCLGEKHWTDNCLHCAKFTKHAHKNQAALFNTHLLKASLQLQMVQWPLGSLAMLPPPPISQGELVSVQDSVQVCSWLLKEQ